MFPQDEPVVVAVSGGPDSLTLLHALVRLRRLLRLGPVTCFHFDHRLRTGSERDAELVEGQAAGLGVPFVLRAATTKPRRGQSVEAWARRVRYRALHHVREEARATVAAVGHTADDQAETVLLSLLKGGGLSALAAMRPAGGPVVRPLLRTTRDQTVAFCRSLGLRPVDDPMNENPAFLRVAVRGLLPELEAAVGRNVRATLVRSAALLREDAEFLDALADQAWRDVAVAGPQDVRLRASTLRELPRPVATRVARLALFGMGIVPTLRHIEGLQSLAGGRPGRELVFPGGLLARRGREYVRLSRSSPAARS